MWGSQEILQILHGLKLRSKGCQSNGHLAEIKKNFSEQYPDHTAYLAGGDPELIAQLKAEIETNK